MPTLQDAEDAKKHVRELITNKSSNKVKATWTDERMKKFKEATNLIDIMVEEQGNWPKDIFVKNTAKSLEYIRRVAEQVGRLRVGNCQQYACAAFVFLENKGVSPIEVVQVKKKGTYAGHAFLIIGRAADKPQNVSKLEKLPDEIFIVDGWANLACSVQDYRKLWKKKLEEWVGDKKGTPHPFFEGKTITFDEEHSSFPGLVDLDFKILGRLPLG